MDKENHTNGKNHSDENEGQPSRWRRFKTWVKKDFSFADLCIITFTGVLAGSAIYQFIIMRGQLDQIQNTNRPYLFTTPKFSFSQMPTPETLREIPVTIWVVNVGVSPALKVVATIPIVGLETDTEVAAHARTCSFSYAPIEGSTLPPNQTFTSGAGLTSLTITRTLSDEERKDVAVTHTKHLIIMGGVKYSGVRAGEYETKYCYVWNAESLNGHTLPFADCPCTKMD